MDAPIFGVYCVDSWLIHNECTTEYLHPDPQLNQQEFYSALAENLIDNNIWLSRNPRILPERTDQIITHPLQRYPIPELRATNSRNRGRDEK